MELLEILEDILQGGGGEEILLLQAEQLALVVVVLRIEHLRDHLGQLDFLGGLNVLALAERAQVNPLGAAGRPHAQGVDGGGVVADNGHVVGHGFHGTVVAVDEAGHAVLLHGVHLTAEMHLAGVVHHSHFPGIAVVQPAVGQLHLLAVHNLLAEQAVFIADGAAHGRQVQAGQAVQEAGRQAAQAAVAQAGFGLFLKHIVHIDAQLGQRLAVHIGGHQVQHVAVHAAAHEKLHRQVVQALGLGGLALLPGDEVLLHDLVADSGGHRLVDLLLAGLLDGAAVVALQLADNGGLDGLFIKRGCWHEAPPYRFLGLDKKGYKTRQCDSILHFEENNKPHPPPVIPCGSPGQTAPLPPGTRPRPPTAPGAVRRPPPGPAPRSSARRRCHPPGRTRSGPWRGFPG